MSARKVKFKPDEAGIKSLTHLEGVGRVVEQTARDIAKDASANAPRRTKFNAKSYGSTKAHLEPDGYHAEAYSDDPFAHLVEFGSVRNPAYRPLTRAARDNARFEEGRTP